jgi:hypothetical protein
MHTHPDPIIARITNGRVGFAHMLDGKMRLWHARLAYESDKKGWPPKWWFPAGTTKVPWNLDVAKNHSTVILCEGILSAVAAGPAAIAIGGKTVTPEALGIIKRLWKKAFVMLDPDAGINRKVNIPGKKDEPDFQLRLVELLKTEGLEVSQARWSRGDNRDPGDLGLQGTLQVIKNSDPMVAAGLAYK